MSEDREFLFEPTFNRSIKVRGTDQRLSSDAGVLFLREADFRLGLTTDLASSLRDPRNPARIRYTLPELLRSRLYALCLGFDAQDDLDFLAHDPAMKAAVWDRPGDRVAAERLSSQPTQFRLMSILSQKDNLEALRRFLFVPILRHQRVSGQDHAVMRGTLDVDGFPVGVRGHQAGSGVNGYFGRSVYYPLLASFSPEGNYDHPRLGDGFVHAILREGKAAGDQGALRFILNAVDKARSLARAVDVRFDAAFTNGKILDALTDRDILFLGRLRTNPVVARMAEPHLVRPVGRPPAEGYEFTVELGTYQAESWRHAQRLVLVVVDTPEPNGQLKLQPDHFILVTNWSKDERTAQELLEHYRNRGTFEDRLGEFNHAIGVHLPARSFEENETLLLLSLLAFNFVNILRSELESSSPNGWDLGRFQRGLLKTGARMLKGARRLLFDITAAACPIWTRLVERLKRWQWPARWPAPSPAKRRPWVSPPSHAHLAYVPRL